MTRKRFVKLLMARGMQRNFANRVSRDIVGSYADAHMALLFAPSLRKINTTIRAIVDGIEEFQNAMVIARTSFQELEHAVLYGTGDREPVGLIASLRAKN